MNILIIESGASKTDWCVVDENNYHLPQTIGFNPYHTDNVEIEATIKQQSLLLKRSIEQIYFYGAGYRSLEAKELIRSILQTYFKTSQIEIYDDMQALVHSFRLQDGLGIILGTGSNACQVVGGNIVKQMNSSGFLLGDEGSASHIAKSLLKDYIEGILPKRLADTFKSQYGLEPQDCLQLFHNYPIDKTDISRYSKFVQAYNDEAYMKNLVWNSFKAFLNRLKLQDFEIRDTVCYGVGSVVDTFGNLFKQALESEGSLLLKIIKTPIFGLIEWVKREY